MKKNIDFEYTKDKLDSFNKFCYFKKESGFKNNIIQFGRKNNIQILNKADFICDEMKKECYCFDDKGLKTYHDGGHQTLSGAIFFGKKIKEINWLNLNK